MMKASMQLQLGQQLTLTPQLQQAIRLLQLSSLELNQEIQQLLESNPLLEIEDKQEGPPEDVIYKTESTPDTDVALKQDEFPDNLPIDTNWDILYPTSAVKQRSGDDAPNYENFTSTSVSLQDHLQWQMTMSPFTEKDAAIATAIIDAINDDGFLTASLEDIQSNFTNLVDPDQAVELDEIEAVLHRIQHFDPIGAGARNLQECLLIQLEHLPSETPLLRAAINIVRDQLDLLAQRKYKVILRKHKLTDHQFEETLHLIRSLNPRPGTLISDSKVEYVIPDVITKKVKGRWSIELNPETIPKLSINKHYQSLIKPRMNNNPDNVFLKTNLQEARWFIKSIQSRHETLLKVSEKIVAHQSPYLSSGGRRGAGVAGVGRDAARGRQASGIAAPHVLRLLPFWRGHSR